MPEPEDATTPSNSTAPIVLVVDDEPTARSTITRMIRGMGYPSRSCRSGRDALEFLAAHPRTVRLLIADLLMPGMDGGELAERAIDLDPGLRVVLLAGEGEESGRDLLAGYRDLPVLTKPITFGSLYGKLEELLGAPYRPPSYPPSMGPPRPRSRRRSSGQHGG
jgi:CheY-like chemotaxis protein